MFLKHQHHIPRLRPSVSVYPHSHGVPRAARAALVQLQQLWALNPSPVERKQFWASPAPVLSPCRDHTEPQQLQWHTGVRVRGKILWLESHYTYQVLQLCDSNKTCTLLHLYEVSAFRTSWHKLTLLWQRKQRGSEGLWKNSLKSY